MLYTIGVSQNNKVDMDSKIQELTDKVYNEGVLKGKEEAERIIQLAQEKASKIEAEANEQAKRILLNAEQKSGEIRQNVERELRLQATQIIEATRASLVEELTGKIATENIQAMKATPETIQRIILEIVKGFDLNKGVEISTPLAQELETYFAQNARELLERGVTIRHISGQSANYTLRPSDGSFKLEIGEDTFLELFKSLLRPQLSQQLF